MKGEGQEMKIVRMNYYYIFICIYLSGNRYNIDRLNSKFYKRRLLNTFAFLILNNNYCELSCNNELAICRKAVNLLKKLFLIFKFQKKNNKKNYNKLN